MTFGFIMALIVTAVAFFLLGLAVNSCTREELDVLTRNLVGRGRDRVERTVLVLLNAGHIYRAVRSVMSLTGMEVEEAKEFVKEFIRHNENIMPGEAVRWCKGWEEPNFKDIMNVKME